MNPRAWLRWSRAPKSAASRLEVRTTTGPLAVLHEPLGDREPVRVRQQDVEEDEIGTQLLDRGHGRGTVLCLADDLKPPASRSRRAKPRKPAWSSTISTVRTLRIVAQSVPLGDWGYPQSSAGTRDFIDAAWRAGLPSSP